MGIDSLRNFSLDEGLDNRDLIGKDTCLIMYGGWLDSLCM